MAGEEDPTHSATSRPQRRRTAPTIDLAATDAASAASDPAGENSIDPPSDEGTGRAAGPAAREKRSLSLAPIVAGAVGAAVVVLLAVALALFGLIEVRGTGLGDLATRLAQLETAQAPRPEAAAALNDLSGRLAKLEAALAAPRPVGADPELAERLRAVEAANRSLAGRMDDLSSRIDATAKAVDDISQAALAHPPPPPDGDAANIDRLGGRVAALESRLSSSTAGPAADRALRLAVLAAALKSAAERGVPFVAEVAAMQPLVTDANALAPLAPFAKSGLPTAAALATELSALIPTMSRMAETPVSSNLLDRLQSGASRLVRIRPLDEPQGDDPADVLTRLEIKTARADIAGALAELAKLPPPIRAPADAWIAKAEARNAALAAAQHLASATIDALGTAVP